MNKIPFVDLFAQYNSIKDDIDSAIKTVIEKTAFVGGSSNPFNSKFENEFASFLGIKQVISCANGTDSLEILLKAYQICESDEVIVPAITWISTAEAVSSVGAKPVFVDIDPLYYIMDVTKIEQVITANTKAIIAVHLYGHPVDMDPLMELAAKHGLTVIEDCAQSHGAIYKEKKIGTIGHASSFSFYPGKNLGAYGDAGCMATNDEKIAERCRMIANHGQKGKHNHLIEGRNSRMDGLQAAILSVKLPFLNQWTKNRIDNAAKYSQAISNKNIITPQTKNNCVHVFHLYVIQTPNREMLVKKLKENLIETAIHYPTALPFLPCYQYQGKTHKDFPVAASIQDRILSLPMYAELTGDSINTITELVNEFG